MTYTIDDQQTLAHKFERMTVVDILRGKRVGKRGEAHEVAIALGMNDREMAERLQLSRETVRTHVVNLFGKLHVDSRLKDR